MEHTRTETAPCVYDTAKLILLRTCDKKCVSLTLTELGYMMSMLHIVKVQLRRHILAQKDVISYANVVLWSFIFAVLPCSTDGKFPYDQLCMELKLHLI